MSQANDVVLDRALNLWFSQRRSKEYPISGSMLCEKARNQRPCSEKTKVYNGTANNKLLFSTIKSQIEAHEIHRGNGLDVRLSLALALSTIQVTVRFSSVKFPKGQ
ncbi:hypothetical protein TNCV_4744071 [Trichonephila clavipes]|nr:hypothetical protein TNCV_4744071 [Trichonephila clavipes]